MCLYIDVYISFPGLETNHSWIPNLLYGVELVKSNDLLPVSLQWLLPVVKSLGDISVTWVRNSSAPGSLLIRKSSAPSSSMKEKKDLLKAFKILGTARYMGHNIGSIIQRFLSSFCLASFYQCSLVNQDPGDSEQKQTKRGAERNVASSQLIFFYFFTCFFSPSQLETDQKNNDKVAKKKNMHLWHLSGRTFICW